MDTSASALNRAMAAELRAERSATELTLEALVSISGVKLSTLRRILKAQVDINVADLGAIAAAFDTTRETSIPPDELLRKAIVRAGGYEVLSERADMNVFQLRPKQVEEMEVEEIESIQRYAANRDPEANEDEHFD